MSEHRSSIPVCEECGYAWPCPTEQERRRLHANIDQPGAPTHDLGCPGGSRDGFGRSGGPCECPAEEECEIGHAVRAVGDFFREGRTPAHAWSLAHEDAA